MRRQDVFCMRLSALTYHNNCCDMCGSTKKLQFAHLQPTGLNGMGRGSYSRYVDILTNFDKYALLCKNCHSRFDMFANLTRE